jgi:hypothetical protein
MGLLTSLQFLDLCKFAIVASSELDKIILWDFYLTIYLLYTVVVDSNQLTGPIPSELGLLTSLRSLRLRKFAIVASSELDKTIAGISLLQFISSTVVVDYNDLTGPIPSAMGGLTSLEDLSLGKFAIVASSELDTITLLGPVSQFISSTVL